MDVKKYWNNLVNFVKTNPELATQIGIYGPILVKLVKSGALSKVFKAGIANLQSGMGVKEAFTSAITTKTVGSGLLKTAKAAGVMAAVAIAAGTVKEAVKSGKAAINEKEAGWKKIVDFAWGTSIPGATVNQIKSFIGWLTKKPDDSGNNGKKLPFNNDNNGNKKPLSDEELNAQAKELGMVPVPTNPTARNEWMKKFNQLKKGNGDMGKKDNVLTNSPDWYFKGKADKLLSTTLTWSGLKDHTSAYRFVPVSVLHVSLTLPMEGKYLHHQIIDNNNILFQALRGKNTGAFQYTEEDVYRYQLTLTSLIAIWRFTAKLISLVNKHDPEVERLPQALLAGYYNDFATNVNTGAAMYNDIIANRPQYISQLNDIAKTINTYALKGSTLISRWNYIADKCFRDYNGPKAVYGYYALRQVPSLNATDGSIKILDCEKKTIPQLLTMMSTVLDDLRTYNHGVLLKVAGDMIKLLGANSETFANVPYVTGKEEYKFDFDPEAYDQIRNAKVLPWGIQFVPSYDRNTAGRYAISLKRSDTGNINPRYLSLIANEYFMFSDRNKQFEPKENVQMIQFVLNASATSSTPSNSITLEVDDCGTTTLDVVVNCMYNAGNGDIQTDTFTTIISDVDASTDAEILLHNAIHTMHPNNHGTSWMQELAQIDFMPRYQLFKAARSTDFLAEVADNDNYAYISKTQYKQLNNIAVYSQFWLFNPEDVKIMGLLG